MAEDHQTGKEVAPDPDIDPTGQATAGGTTPSNPYAWIVILIEAFAVIGFLYAAISNLQEISEWSTPIKIVALIIPAVLWLGFELLIKNDKRKESLHGLFVKIHPIAQEITPISFVKIVRMGAGGFILLMGITFALLRLVIPPPPPPYYFMFVLDASENMTALFDGETQWDAVQEAFREQQSNFPPRANYGLILIGGQSSDGTSSDPCQSPVEPVMPFVSPEGKALRMGRRSKDTLLTSVSQQQPFGGGSFGTAFSLAFFQLLELPRDTDKWIIFITGPSDSCESADEWDHLEEKIEIAEEMDIHVISQIVILDETDDSKVKGFIERTADNPSVNVHVAHNRQELQQIIYIILISMPSSGQEKLPATDTPTVTPKESARTVPGATQIVGVPFTGGGGQGAASPTANTSAQITPSTALPPPITNTPLVTATPSITFTPTLTSTPTSTLTGTPTRTRTPTMTRTRVPLPTWTKTATLPPSGGTCDCSYNRYNCSSFQTQSEAQACYDYCISLGVGDIHKLDSDNDGKVCESLP